MAISLWRFSHLVLAITASLFVLLASLSGIVLAYDAAQRDLSAIPSIQSLGDPSLASTLAVLQEEYTELYSLETDTEGRLLVSALRKDGEMSTFYAHPISGKYLGEVEPAAEFVQFNLALHRSLFLKTAGRVAVGIGSFLLVLITLTGAVLLVKRQQGLKHLFKRVLKDNRFQWSHTTLGRLCFIPIFIIALSGTYLSLLRFAFIPDPQVSADYVEEGSDVLEPLEWNAIPLFQQTKLSEVRNLEFPFMAAPGEYFTLSTQSSERLISQMSGETISEVKYPIILAINRLSSFLHTGQGSWLWALILGLTTLSLPYFIYSGFWMSWQRTRARFKNRFPAKDCTHVIAVGSETGTTNLFAQHFQQQLEKQGYKAYITSLNSFKSLPKLEHLFVFTATYGAGEAPISANTFAENMQAFKPHKPFAFSVLGFGSTHYPDFCQFAKEVDEALEMRPEATRLLPLYTVNQRSADDYRQYLRGIEDVTSMHYTISGLQVMQSTPKHKQRFRLKVLQKAGHSFTVHLAHSKRYTYQSGDLLAIKPADDPVERLYSIGKLSKGKMLLAVRHYSDGKVSNALANMAMDHTFKARIVKNPHFYAPKQTPLLMISNGTGIAPFLGILHHRKVKSETQLFWGGRDQEAYGLYKREIDELLTSKKLKRFHLALSRETETPKIYVQDLLRRSAEEVANMLSAKACIMICGSLAMQKDVLSTLDQICQEKLRKPLSFFQEKGQVKMDCY